MDEDELASRHHPIEEDMPAQRRVWRFERVGWCALLLIALLGLTGLFGNGPLSEATVQSADGRVTVDYQRLSRSGTLEDLRIHVQGTAGEPLTVLLGGSLLRKASIETLQPEPLSSLSQGEALLLNLGTPANGTATLYLTLRNEHVGTLEGTVSTGTGSAVRFTIFVYP